VAGNPFFVFFHFCFCLSLKAFYACKLACMKSELFLYVCVRASARCDLLAAIGAPLERALVLQKHPG